METVLTESINTSLKLYMYRNAIFLCERLCAENPSECNLLLLATCYFRNNRAYRAYHILKGFKSEQSRYLFALACLEMGKFAEAETALLPPGGEPGTEVPNGAAGYYILGLICRYTDRRQAAINHFTQTLSLDPFFWCAYEELCLLGAEEDAAALYGDMAVSNLQRQQLQSDLRSQTCVDMDNIESPSGFHVTRSPYLIDGSPKHSRPNAAMDVGTNAGVPIFSSANTPFVGNLASYSTPLPNSSQTPGGSPILNRHGVVGNAPSVGIHGNMSLYAAELSMKAGINAPSQPQRRKVMDEGKLRKSVRSPSTRAAYSQVSGRLFSESAPRRSTRLSGDSGQPSTSGTLIGAFASGDGVNHSSNNLISATSKGSISASLRPGSSRRGLAGAIENSFDDARRSTESFEESGNEEFGGGPIRCGLMMGGMDEESNNRGRPLTVNNHGFRGKKFMEGALDLLNLFRIIGEAFRHLCMYRCQEALQSFSKLPQQHYETGWVLCQVGRAYFEMVDYLEAERAFSWARRVSPYRLEGTDIYSTVLYHMKKEVDLSYLAQETVAIDRLSPQSWCVMGNCFSLQKDHEAALKFFQRALQLDSHFTYAHTLCGHEYVAMENYEDALACYRNAIRIDSRHYNAWYGLGTIYYQQEKFEFAEYHFRRALLINSRSSVLHCYLGMALHALKMNTEALALLDQAIVTDPKNPLAKYQKANVLMSMEKFEDALAELEQLKEVTSRESSVYFLMGKIYKRLNMPEQAMHHFSIALDLKPSTADVNLIKTAIEKLHVPEDLEEDNL